MAVGPDVGEDIPIVSLISFLFGVSGQDELPGPGLVRLVGDLGVSDAAVRSAIARMRAHGHLAGTRRGRITHYRLVGPAASGFQHARQLGHPTERPERGWRGEFAGLLYAVPERHRRHRDRLRSAALLLGYAPFGSGLLIATSDRWDELGPVVEQLPTAVTVYPVALRMRLAHARAAALDAWGLEAIAEHLGALVATLESAVRDRPGPSLVGAAALRRFAALTVPVYRSFVVVPPLPPELLPDGWPQTDLVRALAAVHEVYGPPAHSHVAVVLGVLSG